MKRPLSQLIPLLVFSLLSLILTYPLITHFTTHVNGSQLWAFDEYIFVWNTWWFQYALLHLQQPPLQTDYLYYPLGIDFALYTYNFFNAALALPLLAWLPLPAAVNLINLFSLVMSAYGTYLLAKYSLFNLRSLIQKSGIQKSENENQKLELAALCAGIAYAFTTHKYVYASIGHYDMISTEWFPFGVLYLLKWRARPSLKSALMIAGCCVFTLYIETFFGVFLAFLLLFFGIALRVWRPAGWRVLLAHGLVIGSVTALLSLPVLWPALRESLRADYALKGWGDAQKLSVDLLGLISPSALISWAGLDWSQEMGSVIHGQGRFADVNTVFVGYVTLSLALIGWLAYRRVHNLVGWWFASAITWAIFSLGPLLQIYGQSEFDLDGLKVNFPLPFILLHFIPIIKANRVANRFSVLLVLCLAVLIGYGVYFLLSKFAVVKASENKTNETKLTRALPYLSYLPQLLYLLFPLLLILDHLSLPLPLTNAQTPSFYAQLAADPDDYTILQLPLGWRNSFGTLGAEDTRVQYYQTTHRKRILGGYTSRNPAYKFEYFAQLPIVSSLIAIEAYKTVSPAQQAFDRLFADEFIRFFDLRYVVVHPPVPGRKPYDDTRGATLQYLLSILPVERIPNTGELEVYRVKLPAPQPDLVIDFGEPASRAYRGEGWGNEEEIAGPRANWLIGTQARVFLPSAALKDHELSFSALPFTFPNAPAQTITLHLNDQMLVTLSLKEGWQEYRVRVPAVLLKNGLNELVVDTAYAKAPRDVLPGSDDARNLSIALEWMRWTHQ